ncbi:MAG TPA: sigma-70 family RNA polymerase sigma factor [Thermoanaerobaculia bacterium]|nr:sigma-70 family RNA polymerase sigma factor [Thermoanaerobaculia bacterium]
MKGAGSEDLTELLQAWSEGDRGAGEMLLPLVYQELRRQAARSLRRERPDHTLRPTDLVHEAYLRLVGQHGGWRNRRQFFAVAAQMMRRILVDHARARARAKRAGGWARVPLDEAGQLGVYATTDVDLLALEEALDELAQIDPQRCRLVELRFFAGLSVDDTADVLGVSPSTVDRDWRVAKAWLFRRLQQGAVP